MNQNSIQSVGFQKQNGVNRIDYKELEVARKLVSAGIVSTVQEFMNLSEDKKCEKVHEYNKLNPTNPIEDKGAAQNVNSTVNSTQANVDRGSEMNKFLDDIDWKKLKLQ